MKKTVLNFLLSTFICCFVPVIFWYFTGNSGDLRFLSDYFFLIGVSFFIVGMVIALFATSRWHYYRHLKKKWQGKESEKEFDKNAIKRKEQTLLGAAIALSGILGFAISGFISIKIGY